MVKTFRGLLADGSQTTIRLSTNNGMTGYVIHKFQAVQNTPSTGQSVAACIKLYTRKQDTVDNIVNFDDPTLLGVLYYQDNNATNETSSVDIIFDATTFNQDIFVTHIDSDGAVPMNYYLELEQVRLDLSEATVATLKDMRGRE